MSEETANAQTCPSCGEVGADGASWCEACGADFAGEHSAIIGPACVDCGADHEHIVQGYCGECGRKQPGERDHQSEDLGAIVAVTDRGKRHHQNEDAYAIGIVGDQLIAIACDGVSTTDHPQEASLAAATTARDALVTSLEANESDIEAVLVKAVEAAQVAAAAVPIVPGGEGPASTTFVASIVVPDPSDSAIVRTWTAWLGDSRAYWVHDEAGGVVVTQLTTDDVLGQSITRWLGADAGDTAPTIQVFEHDAGGRLLLCSDGLWKYVPAEADLAELLTTHAGETSALDLAEALIAFANEQGGHDNTTVVIATP
jgi:serine/threonine protein phosphatase PrpC